VKILVACLAGITAMGAVSSTASAAPIRVLYAPSESDDPFYRSGIAAALPPGSVVDYYDARASTPDSSLLASYDAVHTWPSLGYQDSVEFGNRLADFVDLGWTVVLGARYRGLPGTIQVSGMGAARVMFSSAASANGRWITWTSSLWCNREGESAAAS
jgi:hypothetical protein